MRRKHRKASGPLPLMRLDAKRRHAYAMYAQSIPVSEIAEKFDTTQRQIYSWINYEIRATEVIDPTEVKDRQRKMNEQLEVVLRKALEIVKEADKTTKEGKQAFVAAAKTVNETIARVQSVNGMEAEPLKGLGKGISEGLTEGLYKMVAGLAKPVQATIVDSQTVPSDQ